MINYPTVGCNKRPNESSLSRRIIVSTGTIVLLVILGILIVSVVVLYFLGKKAQKRGCRIYTATAHFCRILFLFLYQCYYAYDSGDSSQNYVSYQCGKAHHPLTEIGKTGHHPVAGQTVKHCDENCGNYYFYGKGDEKKRPSFALFRSGNKKDKRKHKGRRKEKH